MIGAGSATYNHPLADRRARYNIYTISNPGPAARFTIEQRVYNPTTRTFAPAPTT